VAPSRSMGVISIVLGQLVPKYLRSDLPEDILCKPDHGYVSESSMDYDAIRGTPIEGLRKWPHRTDQLLTCYWS
jgi:hypothetical protein